MTGLLGRLDDVNVVRGPAAWIGAARAAPASEEDAVNELDRLEAAMSECREMIREAHAATKDLRAAVREAKQEARTLAADEVSCEFNKYRTPRSKAT